MMHDHRVDEPRTPHDPRDETGLRRPSSGPMTVSERVGVVGLGVMGSAMAKNLVAAGFQVVGYDIDAERSADAENVGVTVADSVADLAARSSIVILSLPSVDALEEVSTEIAARPTPDLLCLETGTLPLAAKKAAHDRLSSAGMELMDVPLSGTGLQAADATLVIFASGSEDGFNRCQGVFDAIGRSAHYLGEFGNGSKMKYIANLLVAVHTLAAAEAHSLGIAAGMSPAIVQDVMEDGVGSSKIFEIRGPMMVADDYPAAARLDIILKDAKLIKEFAEGAGAHTPLLDQAVGVYAAASDAGLGSLDAAALCRYLEQEAGLQR